MDDDDGDADAGADDETVLLSSDKKEDLKVEGKLSIGLAVGG